MNRLLPFAAALAFFSPACRSGPDENESTLSIFDRIAFLFHQYDAAQARQDAQALGVISGDLNRVTRAHFDRVLSALSSEDQERVGFAAFALGFSNERAAVEPLVKLTDHANVAVRSSAIFAVGVLAFEDIPMEPFKKLLDDKLPEVRQATLFGLRPLVSDSNDRGMLEAVHKKVADPDLNVRNEALILLRKMRRKESLEKVLGVIKDAEPLLRSNAALAIGALEKEGVPANPHLIEMLKDETSKVVESAWVALNKINQKDFDRSYATWRDWYEDEQRHYYSCLEHKEVNRPTPGDCPTCGKKLERIPKDGVKKVSEPVAGLFVCPDHEAIQTTTPAKCGKPGCGKDLVPKKPEGPLYVCPDHPEIQTATPAKCGKPGCGKDLVPPKK